MVRIPRFLYVLLFMLLASFFGDVRLLELNKRGRNTLVFDTLRQLTSASTPSALTSNSTPSALTSASTPSASGQRPRVLLGIASLNSTAEDARVRRIIKHTYLDNFDSKLLGDSEFKVCSLNDLKKLSKDEIERCRLVYTFLLYSNVSSAAFEKEPDAMFLPPRKLLNNDTMAEWFSFSADTMAAQNYVGSFDYVMFATNEITFLPNVFLNENTAMRKYDPFFFGGMPKNDSNFGGLLTSCGSRRSCLGEGFLALSSDLVRQFSRNLPSLKQTNVPQSSISRIRELLNRTTYETTMMKGVREQSSIAIDSLKQWDQHVVESVEFVDKEEVKRVAATNRTVPSFDGAPKMLFGIFTWNATGVEIERRQAIRDTYLSAYKGTDTPNRICSLQDLLAKKVKEEECQLAYTFVYGMLDRGDIPALRMNATSLEEMNAPDVKFSEPDGLYLNIRENGNEGKTETWLKYGVLLQDFLHFDYIAKVDTDTLVFPSRFFWRLSLFPRFPNNARAYGGLDSIKPADVTGEAIGPSFMLGRFYWVSPDLARYITSECQPVIHFPEDKGIGNCVNSHPLHLQRMRLHRNSFEHKKALKNPSVMRSWWKSHTPGTPRKQ